MSTLICRMTILLLLISGLAGNCLARTLYVDDVAKNGKGTSRSPFNNIQTALNRARGGDVIFLRPGTYSGSWTTRRPGRNHRPISIDGANKANTFIDGLGLEENEGLVICHSNYNVSRITFRNHFRDGLQVVGAAEDSDVSNFIRSVYVSDCLLTANGDSTVEAHGLRMKNVANVFLGDVKCTQNQTNGATLVNCVGGTIRDCEFSDNAGESVSEGLAFLNCQYFGVDDCVAMRNAESGFDSNIFEAIPADARVIEFRGCRASENGGEGFSVNGTLTGDQVSTDHRFFRCLAARNGDTGFVVYQNATIVDIINCTAVLNRNRGVSNFDGGSSIWILNSLFFGNTAPEGNLEDIGGDDQQYFGNFNYWSNFPPPENGNFDAVRGPDDIVIENPETLFSDTESFGLNPLAELIDRGTTAMRVRFNGCAPDIGWLELN